MIQQKKNSLLRTRHGVAHEKKGQQTRKMYQFLFQIVFFVRVSTHLLKFSFFVGR